MKKKIIILLILISIIGAIVYLKSHKTPDKDELSLYGNIEIRQVDLGFRVEGRIKKMFFEEGDSVKKGDLLAILDDINYSAQFEKSLSEIEMNKAGSENANSQYERNLALCADGTTSKLQCDTLLNQKNETKARLEASIGQSKIAKDNLDNTRVYAPNDGIVTTRVQEEGAVVTPSAPVYTVSLTQPVWIRAYVPQTNLGNIKYGMKAKILTDSIDPDTGKKKEYTGWIGYISPVAEFTPKTVQTEDLRTDLVYRIRVYVYDTDEFLRQGMPTTVKINLKETEVRKNLEKNAK